MSEGQYIIKLCSTWNALSSDVFSSCLQWIPSCTSGVSLLINELIKSSHETVERVIFVPVQSHNFQWRAAEEPLQPRQGSPKGFLTHTHTHTGLHTNSHTWKCTHTNTHILAYTPTHTCVCVHTLSHSFTLHQECIMPFKVHAVLSAILGAPPWRRPFSKHDATAAVCLRNT